MTPMPFPEDMNETLQETFKAIQAQAVVGINKQMDEMIQEAVSILSKDKNLVFLIQQTCEINNQMFPGREDTKFIGLCVRIGLGLCCLRLRELQKEGSTS